MSVKFGVARATPNGTVLLVGIRYEASGNPKVYEYAMLKTAGRWYVTGTGQTPQDAGWAAVERWLERDGRVVEYVKMAGALVQIWPDFVEAEEMPAALSEVECRCGSTDCREGHPW